MTLVDFATDEKFLKLTNDHHAAVDKINITTGKLIRHGEKIKKRENILPEDKEKLVIKKVLSVEED